MLEKYTYLLVDFFCIIIPLVCSFHPKINFHIQWKYLFIPCLTTTLIFLVWDALFTRAGIWSFNPKYVSGFYCFGLPVEEYLFFVCIPYPCMFTYYCINKFTRLSLPRAAVYFISFTLVAVLSFIGFTHLPQLYTSITFLSLATILMIVILSNHHILSTFYITCLLILVPFFISNGILTGSFLNRPTVLYNNDYNLGLRMLTIPVEDLFYAMLLLLMNISGFEYLKSRSS